MSLVAKKPKAIDSIGDLTPDPRNARKHTPRNVGSIVDALHKVGAARSIVIDENGVVLAGNATLDAAGQAGIERVQVVDADGQTIIAVRRTGLSKKQKAELAIYDNRAAELAEWDVPALTGLAEEVGLDLQSVEFTADEVETLKRDSLLVPTDPIEDEPPAPEDVEKRSNAGDLWQLGDHFLLCGDCRKPEDMKALLGKARINVAVTSPPYASQRKYDEASGFKPIPPDEYVAWWEAVQANVKRHLAADGSFFVNIKEHAEDGERDLYVKDMTIAMKRRWGWLFVDEFCWRKAGDGVPGKWPNRFRNAWEPVFHFARERSIKMNHAAVMHESDGAFTHAENKDTKRKNSTGSGFETGFQTHVGMALPSNVLTIAEASESDHSAAYPVGLPTFFIKAYSDAGDIIFEPFCGSGTTLIAADQLGRRCYGMEISPKYCDVILARWEAFTQKKACRAEA